MILMVVKSYEQMTDVSIMEGKTYLLIRESTSKTSLLYNLSKFS